MNLTLGSTVFDGRYMVEGVLGQGGMAVVYLVRHTRLDTRMALKVVQASSTHAHARLLREGKVQSAVRHPNIVPVSDVIDIGGLPALILEYVEGPSMDVVVGSYSLTVPQIDDLARGILAGVEHAHTLGFVHRDLKPANILLAVNEGRPVPRVTDFGLVKSLAQEDDNSNTKTGMAMGTVAYMSPEQIRDSGRVDERTDVFALGAILYELLVGEKPFVGAGAFEIQEAIIYGRYERLAERRPDLPEAMTRAVDGALVASRDDRVSSVQELLAAWIGGRPVPGPTAIWSPEMLRELAALTPKIDRRAVSDAESNTWGDETSDGEGFPDDSPTRSVGPPDPSSLPSAIGEEDGAARPWRARMAAGVAAALVGAMAVVGAGSLGLPRGVTEPGPVDYAKATWEASAIELAFDLPSSSAHPATRFWCGLKAVPRRGSWARSRTAAMHSMPFQMGLSG
jgi:serine/threonine-protein kinase